MGCPGLCGAQLAQIAMFNLVLAVIESKSELLEPYIDHFLAPIFI